MPSYNMQTTYPRAMAKGIHGQIASEEKYNGISFSVQTAGGVKFGAPVARGTLDKTCIAYVANGDFLGLTVLDVSPNPAQPGDANIADGYPRNATAGIMTEGSIYLTVNGAVAQGDAVYYNAGSGRYTNVNTDLAIPNAFFDTSATAAGQIAEVSLRHRVA